MRLTIKITMDNAAFECGGDDPGQCVNTHEPSRILRQLSQEIESGCTLAPGDTFNMRDTNGNKVGQAKVTR